jgi:hypothetical protein
LIEKDLISYLLFRFFPATAIAVIFFWPYFFLPIAAATAAGSEAPLAAADFSTAANLLPDPSFGFFTSHPHMNNNQTLLACLLISKGHPNLGKNANRKKSRQQKALNHHLSLALASDLLPSNSPRKSPHWSGQKLRRCTRDKLPQFREK